MPFINKTQLTLSHLIKDSYSLLAVFNREGGRKALALVNSYLLNTKEIKGKTIPLVIVLEPPFILKNQLLALEIRGVLKSKKETYYILGLKY